MISKLLLLLAFFILTFSAIYGAHENGTIGTNQTANAVPTMCPDKQDHQNPLAWVTDMMDMKDVLYVCDFFINNTYICNYTVEGAKLMLPPTAVPPTPEGKQLVFKEPENRVNLTEPDQQQDALESPQINIQFISDGGAKISLYCSGQAKQSKSDEEPASPHIKPLEQLQNWGEKDGVLKENITANTPIGFDIVAKCFFQESFYECFGIPTCSGNCDEPCYGGEPWRGNYTGTPRNGFKGIITSEAVASSGSNDPLDAVVPLAICPSQIPREDCGIWKATFVFLNQFAEIQSKLCTNLAYLLQPVRVE